MIKRLTSSQWIVVAVLALIGAAVLWLVVSLMVQYIQLSQQAEEIKPKLARFYGLIQSESQLTEANQTLGRQLANLTYEESEDINTLGARMQQAAREIFTGEGLSIDGSQVLPFKAEQGFTVISVRIDVEGEYENLEPALLRLRDARPIVFIESIEVTPARRQRGSRLQKVAARIKLVSLKMGE